MKLRKRIFTFILTIPFILTFIPKVYSDTIDEVRSVIKDNYVDAVPDEVLNKSTVAEIVYGLNDPYSKYFTKDEYTSFVNSINNKLIGIGVVLEKCDNGMKILSLIANSPAEKAGIKPGDIIISANGQSLAGKEVEESRTYIIGEAGTSVKIEINRDGQVFTFDLIREEITAPTVTDEVYGNIGIIHLTSFGVDSAGEFSKALDDLKQKDVKGYIVDIRNNGGGYVSTAQDIAGNFIGGKNIVLIVKGRDGIRYGWLSPDKDYSTIDKKVVFLVNGYSASASEILSAAIKDYGKAVLVGNKTFGKGVMQSMFTLSDESVLKLTINRFYSPLNENVIQKVGINPDIDTGKDDALKSALELFGDSGESLDKSGYIKFNMDGFDWEVNYDSVIQSNYKERYYNILNGIPAVSSISVGNKNGWDKFGDKKIQDITSIYYNNSQDFKTILKDNKFLSFIKKEHTNDLSNLPDGLVVGDKEYSLSYLADSKNTQEIINLIKENKGKLYGRIGGVENSKVVNIFNKKPIDISNYNSVTYINDSGQETKYTNEFLEN